MTPAIVSLQTSSILSAITTITCSSVREGLGGLFSSDLSSPCTVDINVGVGLHAVDDSFLPFNVPTGATGLILLLHEW